MTVYIDDADIPFGRMLMSHMWADTDEELLAMADTIGVQRKWIQGHPKLSWGKHKNASWVHFDVAKGHKAKAIKAGAVLTDRYGPLEFEAKKGLALASTNLDTKSHAHWTEKLAMIAEARARRETE